MVKIGFVTCVQLGLSCMEAIYQAGGELRLAVTLEDKQAVNKSGRIYLNDFCQHHNVPLLKSSHVNNTDVIEAIKSYQIDWLFIIGWSQIASKSVLQAPKQGVLGMHPTLLPMGRGRAAIPWAILKRLPKTGVTLFKMDSGVDTGAIVDQVEIDLYSQITATELYQIVNSSHIQLIHKVIPDILNGSLTLITQDESRASEWPGRKPEDGEINLQGSIYDAECLIRAVTKPYPGAFILQNGKKIIIWEAKIISEPSDKLCLYFSDGVLECLDVEYQGDKVKR